MRNAWSFRRGHYANRVMGRGPSRTIAWTVTERANSDQIKIRKKENEMEGEIVDAEIPTTTPLDGQSIDEGGTTHETPVMEPATTPGPLASTQWTPDAPSAEVSMMLAEICFRANNGSYREGQTFETEHVQRLLKEPAMSEWLKQFGDGERFGVQWKV